MHEASIAQDLIDLMLRACEGQDVLRIRTATLEIGELSGVEPHALSFAFEVISRGTLAEGCELVVQRPVLRIQCPVCEHQGDMDRELMGCPQCGQTPVRVIQGREMRLVSIDVEDEDHASDSGG